MKRDTRARVGCSSGVSVKRTLIAGRSGGCTRWQVNISRKGSKAGIARGGCLGIDCSEFLHELPLRPLSLQSDVNVAGSGVIAAPRALGNSIFIFLANYARRRALHLAFFNLLRAELRAARNWATVITRSRIRG